MASAETPDRANVDLRREGRVFGRYLLGRPINEPAVALYLAAVTQRQVVLTRRDQRLYRFLMRHPSWIGSVDAGLAILRPDSAIRVRLLIMMAILEVQPDLADEFLPGGGGLRELVVPAFRAGFRVVTGVPIVMLA